eukprot:SAG31_NODE_1016_length_10365_cov_16.138418_6_plen_138_part_00
MALRGIAQLGVTSAGDLRQNGFVTFTSIRAATIARQVIHDPGSGYFENTFSVVAAPPPVSIIWQNLGLRFTEKQSRATIGLVLTGGLVFLWTIPVCFPCCPRVSLCAECGAVGGCYLSVGVYLCVQSLLSMAFTCPR